MPPKQAQQQSKAKQARTEDGDASPQSNHDVDRAAAAASAGAASTAQLGAEDKYKTGPFSLLYSAVHTPTTRVLILLRNQKRLVARVRAFDRHFNMLLQDGQEISNEKDAATGEHKLRHIPKLFLRGDTVISVVAVKKED